MGKMGLVYKLTSCRRFNSNSFRLKSAKNHTTRLLSQPNPNCACKVIETISKSKIRATAIAALHFNILTQITQLMMAKVIKCRQLWITSFGIGCAYGHPSVYVKVSNYIDWMESVIMP